MPLVKIDITRGVRTQKEVRKLADVVQDTMLANFNAPPRDRYQVLYFSSVPQTMGALKLSLYDQR